MKEIKWNESLDLSSPLSYILVTSISGDGKPNIIGIGWWTFANNKPHVMTISVGNNRQSYKNIKEVGEFVPSDIDSSYEVVEQLVEVGMFYRGGTSLHRLYGFAPHPRLIAEALGNRLAIKANEAARRAEWELDEYGA